MRASPFLILVVMLGCHPMPPPLGWSDADTVALEEVPELAHVAKRIKDAEYLQVQHLFDETNARFTGAPNPEALLLGFHELNQTRSAGNAAPLTVLTYNVALLHARPLGIEYAKSPELEVRREKLADLVLEKGFDVVMLQEVWLAEDVQRFTDAASRHGYRAFSANRDEYSDGLVTLIKESIIAPSGEVDVLGVPYVEQRQEEYLPGVGIRRGFLRVAFNHKDLGPLRIYNTHMAAFVERWLARMSNARQMGLTVREETGPQELAIIGGDMNAGPYYRDDIWLAPDNKQVGDWWANAFAYPLLLYYARSVDLFAMGLRSREVEIGNTMVNNPEKSTTVPAAEEGWCERTPHVALTGSDCNSLYFRQYAGTEYSARYDHLLAHDPAGRVKVLETEIVFTEKLDWGSAGSFELSDHYGVRATLAVQRR
ncbi:MAG: endonuclease/exonuclease/phosphatase family protein [Myxococcota bacterium]